MFTILGPWQLHGIVAGPGSHSGGGDGCLVVGGQDPEGLGRGHSIMEYFLHIQILCLLKDQYCNLSSLYNSSKTFATQMFMFFVVVVALLYLRRAFINIVSHCCITVKDVFP